jgi:hypothetical protein
MMVSGVQVVHQMAKGISNRMVGGPVACVLRPLAVWLKPLERLLDRLESREAGG